MGYYANYSGYIKVNEEPTKEIMDATYVFEDLFYSKQELRLDISGFSKYFEEDVYNFLELIKPIVASGEIEYSGEDGASWHFIFKDNEWKEENGSITYGSVIQEEDQKEFIGQIIDMFDDAIDPDNPVFTDKRYYEMQNKLISFMKGWNIF